MRDVGSIPGSERSPGGGHNNPIHYFCLENPMDRGAWHRVTKSWAQLNTYKDNIWESLWLWFRLIPWASLVAQMVKGWPAVQETQVWSLGREDPLKRGMATHSMPHNLESDHGSFYSCLIMYPTHKSFKLSLSIIAVEVKQTFLNNASKFLHLLHWASFARWHNLGF